MIVVFQNKSMTTGTLPCMERNAFKSFSPKGRATPPPPPSVSASPVSDISEKGKEQKQKVNRKRLLSCCCVVLLLFVVFAALLCCVWELRRDISDILSLLRPPLVRRSPKARKLGGALN